MHAILYQFETLTGRIATDKARPKIMMGKLG